MTSSAAASDRSLTYALASRRGERRGSRASRGRYPRRKAPEKIRQGPGVLVPEDWVQKWHFGRLAGRRRLGGLRVKRSRPQLGPVCWLDDLPFIEPTPLPVHSTYNVLGWEGSPFQVPRPDSGFPDTQS